MAINEGFITPAPNANPNALGQQEVPVAPISCWNIGFVTSVLAFPTALDEERLKKAFATAASFWPVVCGRFVKSSTPSFPEFAISLTESPIPFSTQTTEDEYPYPTKNVIQESLGSYAPPLRDDFFVPGADAPQVAVRLSTLANGNSVLGINWGHVLGDAAAFSRFLEDVSLFYNMGRFADLGDDMPTFAPHVTIPLAGEKTLKDYHLDLLEPMGVPEVFKGYSDATTAGEFFTVRLSRRELAHITASRTAGEHCSDGDMLSGWWIGVLERAGRRVDRAVQTINYRSWHQGDRAFPRNLATLVANVAQMREIPVPSPTQGQKPAIRARTVARAIRGGMQELKNDREVMLKWLGNAAYEIGRASHEGKTFCLVPRPGGVVINSNMRYDWAIKFGQPGADYHTDVCLTNFLRVFLANAAPGQEAAPVGERDVELAFRVEWGPAAEAVQKVIDEDRARWATTEPVAEDESAAEAPIRSFSMNAVPARSPWGE
ncbi:hypothetical protein CspHIS471_0209380 [Cutaneotrichosporon sp. HIS471]|nr:hypothetical protein CspHIS471_0209380 [Cutaneotrichosporon sp. HIS471]